MSPAGKWAGGGVALPRAQHVGEMLRIGVQTGDGDADVAVQHVAGHPEIAVTSSHTGAGIAELRAALAELAAPGMVARLVSGSPPASISRTRHDGSALRR